MRRTKALGAGLLLAVLVALMATPVGSQTVERASRVVSSLTSLSWVRTADGTASAPGWSFASAPTDGVFHTSNQLNLTIGGTSRMNFGSNYFNILDNAAQIALGGTGDTTIARAAAGTITLTGTTPMIQGGGTTASFPAWKRSNAGWLSRLADDSANTFVTASFYNGNSSSILASAATIAPTGNIHHVSGTTAIATITVPAGCTPTCQITLIPDGLWTTTTAGNIALASTAVVNKALILTWDGTKWSPSY